jgi:glutamyl-tRNA reductase
LTIVDIGMPRMVETSVRALPGVTLVDLDTIRSHIDRAVSGRHQVLADAEGVIDQAVHAFLAEQHPEIPLAIPRPRRGTVAQDGMQETVEHAERRSTTATPSSKAS